MNDFNSRKFENKYRGRKVQIKFDLVSQKEKISLRNGIRFSLTILLSSASIQPDFLIANVVFSLQMTGEENGNRIQMSTRCAMIHECADGMLFIDIESDRQVESLRRTKKGPREKIKKGNDKDGRICVLFACAALKSLHCQMEKHAKKYLHTSRCKVISYPKSSPLKFQWKNTRCSNQKRISDRLPQTLFITFSSLDTISLLFLQESDDIRFTISLRGNTRNNTLRA